MVRGEGPVRIGGMYGLGWRQDPEGVWLGVSARTRVSAHSAAVELAMLAAHNGGALRAEVIDGRGQTTRMAIRSPAHAHELLWQAWQVYAAAHEQMPRIFPGLSETLMSARTPPANSAEMEELAGKLWKPDEDVPSLDMRCPQLNDAVALHGAASVLQSLGPEQVQEQCQWYGQWLLGVLDD